MNAPNTPEPTDREATDREATLANRVTLLTLLALCSLLTAMVAMPLTFRATEDTVPRAISSAPLALGVGALARSRTARAELRSLRREADGETRAGPM